MTARVCVCVYQFTHFVTYASFGTSTSLLFAHGLQQSGTIRLEFRAGEPHPHQAYSPGRAALRYVQVLPFPSLSTFSCSGLMQHILTCTASRSPRVASHPERGTLEKTFLSDVHLALLSSNYLNIEVDNINFVNDTFARFIVRLFVDLLLSLWYLANCVSKGKQEGDASCLL